MFFVIPEMPSKTFVWFKKKLPDHFKEYDIKERETELEIKKRRRKSTRVKAEKSYEVADLDQLHQLEEDEDVKHQLLFNLSCSVCTKVNF